MSEKQIRAHLLYLHHQMLKAIHQDDISMAEEVHYEISHARVLLADRLQKARPKKRKPNINGELFPQENKQ